MSKIAHLSIVLSGSLLFGGLARAENWPQWRGPHSDGSSAEQRLPDSLDPAKDLRWSVALPGPGAGTPVVLGDRIFLSSLDKSTKKLLALCLSKADGKTLWSKEVAIDATTNDRNNLASPSPIADDKGVYFYFGTGDLVAFDHEGNAKWSLNVQKAYGKFNMQWLESATPLLLNGKLYVPVLHRDVPVGGGGGRPGGGRPGGGPPGGGRPGRDGPPPDRASGDVVAGSLADSYLLCLDAASGKELWRVVRPTDAVQESREAYTTPIAIPVEGKTQIVLMGGDHLTGHDADTGKELWRTPSYNPTKIGHWRTVASATFGAGLVFASPPKNGPMFAAVPNDGSSAEAKVAWTSREVTTDVCVPLFYDGQLFVLNGDGKKTLFCLDPKTGEKKWALELGGRAVFRASPTGADGKIYCMSESGEVFVASVDGKLLNHAALGSESPARSTIVPADGVVYVRTADHLYAFAAK